MRRLVFSATIDGEDLVRRTGPIRVPDPLRVRVYDDGQTVITTRGSSDRLVMWSGDDKAHARQEILDRLTTLERVGRGRKSYSPDSARKAMSPTESEAQRRSFAYGNARVDNERVSRETVDRAAKKLSNTAARTKRES